METFFEGFLFLLMKINRNIKYIIITLYRVINNIDLFRYLLTSIKLYVLYVFLFFCFLYTTNIGYGTY